MSLRRLLPVLVLALGCAGGNQTRKSSDEPTTAREKQLREAEKTGDIDPPRGRKSGGRWRYKGDRDNCFFVVGARCFKTEEAACKAARCKKKGSECTSVGAAPATVSCKAP